MLETRTSLINGNYRIVQQFKSKETKEDGREQAREDRDEYSPPPGQDTLLRRICRRT
jgi:hypothetical protein